MRDAQSTDVRGALNPRARDVERPGEYKSNGKADRNQDDEYLLDPWWCSKDGQNRAADLDQTRCDDAIGQRDTINSPIF
jgi:hypothetical protein